LRPPYPTLFPYTTLFRSRVHAQVSARVRNAPKNHAYVTPSLMLVRTWFKPDELIPDEVGDLLAMLALARRVRRTVGWSQATRPGVLIADAGVSRERVQPLRAALGITKHEIMPTE